MPICGTCGQNFEVDASKVLSNVMSEYVDAKTGKVDCVLNTAEPKVIVGKKELVRSDLYKEVNTLAAPAKSVDITKPASGPTAGEGASKQTAVQSK